MVPKSPGIRGSTRHWTQSIRRAGGLISERLTPCHVVHQSHAAPVTLVARHGHLFDLTPGQMHTTYASGIVRVANEGPKSGS